MAGLVSRLFDNNNYLSKEAFCQVATHVYPLVSEGLQNELIKKYLTLINENDLLVRKIASQHISKLSKLMPTAHDNELVFAI